MKICLVIDSLPEYHKNWGGAEMIGFSLAQVLQKEGQNLSILTSNFDCKKKNLSENIFQIKTLRIKNSKFSFLSNNFPLDVFSIFYSVYILRKIKPDIVHFHSKKLFLPVMVASMFLRIPTVFTFLDYFAICPKLILLKPNNEICTKFQGSNCAECYLKKCYFKKCYFKKGILRPLFFLRAVIFKYFLKKIDIIIVLSKNSQKILGKYGLSGKRIKTIYQYQINFKNILKKDDISFYKEPFLLFSGAICERHKGLHILIKAMADIVSEFPSIKLKVLGTLNNRLYKEEIDNLINDLGLGSNVEFMGQKKNEEVLQMIPESKAVVVPEQWLNPGPVISLEAMFLGKPVIASNIGGIPELIKDNLNGFLADRDKPEQFAQKIIWLLKNNVKAELMGEKAKESVKCLLEKNQAKEIVSLYNNIISKTN